jgi:hypothetical protein
MNYPWPRMTEDESCALTHRLSYEVRVRGTLYLWGSAGITQNTSYTSPLLLHIRNDEHGEVVTLGTQVAAGTQTTYGTLQPGECYSIPIQQISGVFASCALESTVYCVIASHSGSA